MATKPLYSFNIESSDMMPSITELLFLDICTKVEFHPVILLEGLKKAIEQMSQNMLKNIIIQIKISLIFIHPNFLV